MKRQTLLLALGLYLVSAIASYSVFSYFGKYQNQANTVVMQQTADNQESLLNQLLDIDPSEPQDQSCPLNGKFFTQTERFAWEKRRPLAVMIENHAEARPQSGLSAADIVFEAIAEGGVTRFMGLFYCGVQRFDTTLAPIRSARSYFIDWASGFNYPLYVHVGGANLPGPADALGQIVDYGWVGENDLNQFSIGYPTFVRDYNRLEGREIATEHTMITTSEELWKIALKRDWTNIAPLRKIGRSMVGGDDWQVDFQPWKFQDSQPSSGTVTKIAYDFWSGFEDYAVSWEYDPQTNSYQRIMANEKHFDLNNNQQIAASNVIVLFTTQKGPIDEKKHLLYTTTGEGEALIFNNGNATKATWSKKTRTAGLKFLNNKGKDISLTRGLTWISVVSKTTDVAY